MCFFLGGKGHRRDPKRALSLTTSAAVGGAKDTVDLRERLHRLIEESKLLSVDTKELIKDLGNIANGGYQGGGTGNQRQRLEARKLSDEFTKSLQRFQEVRRAQNGKQTRRSLPCLVPTLPTNTHTHRERK